MNRKIEEYLPVKRNNYFLLSGRSALFLAFSILSDDGEENVVRKNIGRSSDIKKAEILIPAYSPQGVISPIKRFGLRYRCYDINPDFSLNSEEIKGRITDKTKAILIIHNFGFPQDIKMIKEICEVNGLRLIEDCAQGFLSRYENGTLLGEYGDFSVFSLTKTLKIQDGAVLSTLSANSYSGNGIKFEIRPTLLSRVYQTLRKRAIQSESPVGKSVLYKVSYHLLNSFLVSPVPMSDSAMSDLEKVDFEEIIRRRRENFKMYLDFISEFGVSENKRVFLPFPSLKQGTCPFGFPLLVESGERDVIYNRLKKEGIYCLKSKGWDLIQEQEANKFPNSWRIIKQILILPVSQDTSEGTVEKACEIVGDSLKCG